MSFERIYFSLIFVFIAMLQSNVMVYSQPFNMPGQNYLSQPDPKEIQINNRVLFAVNGKAITVMDVQKKMEIIFNREFPEYADSLLAKYQFYVANWYSILNEAVNRELIIEDAHDKKLPVSDGDVREELENMFGPNIIEELHKLNMSYDEAWEHVLNDITLKRMMIYRVNLKAREAVTPEAIKMAYQEMVKRSSMSNKWKYRVITIRDPKKTKAQEAAQVTFDLLTKKHIPIEMIAQTFQHHQDIDRSTSKITVTQEYIHNTEELSPTYKDVLSGLQAGCYSAPVAQHSRSGSGEVYRIFYLTGLEKVKTPSFEESEDTIKDELLRIAMGRETEKYISQLRKHYSVSDESIRSSLPENFHPFTLIY